jgi:hypothetical protein
MREILAFLALFNCYPVATITPSNETFFLGGVIYMRPDMVRREVLIHELVHACDYSARGSAKNRADWVYRERRAMAIEGAYIDRERGGGGTIRPLNISLPMALK